MALRNQDAPRQQGRAAATAAIALAALVLAGGCQWQTITVRGPERAVPPTVAVQDLPLDTIQRAVIDCPSGECNARFRLDITAPGRLMVKVSPLVGQEPEWLRVVLKNALQEVIGMRVTEFGQVLEPEERALDKALELRETVRGGWHYLLVQSIGGPVPFDIRARLISP